MTTPSIIVIVDFSTTATDRQAAIAQLEREQPVVSEMSGCVAFRVFASRQNDTDITVLHGWTDTTALDEYLSSEVFARSGDVLRPMMTGSPSSRRFHVELIETAA